jgi:hypothetical protein
MSPLGGSSVLMPDSTLAVIGREVRIRLLNCSASGCLIEASSKLEVGTIATLAVTLQGEEFVDDVQVVRCQQIEGAGVFHVGAQFLWMATPKPRSLRQVIRRTVAFATHSPPLQTHL